MVKKSTIIQFIKFSIIGFLNTGIDFLVYYGLTRFFLFGEEHKNFAVVIAFLMANINSYLLNKFWTFTNKEKDHRIQYSKFLVVSVIGLIINIIIFNILLWFNINDLIAKIAPIPVVLIWNFLINKFWTFQDRQK